MYTSVKSIVFVLNFFLIYFFVNWNSYHRRKWKKPYASALVFGLVSFKYT